MNGRQHLVPESIFLYTAKTMFKKRSPEADHAHGENEGPLNIEICPQMPNNSQTPGLLILPPEGTMG